MYVYVHPGRQVVGFEVILGALARSGSQQKQLNKLRVLDAGAIWEGGREGGRGEGCSKGGREGGKMTVCMPLLSHVK